MLMRVREVPALKEMLDDGKPKRSVYQNPEERWASFAGATSQRMQ